MLKDFHILQDCLNAILNPTNHTIMVLGGADTGKTTLIEELTNLLAPDFTVGIVDCDMGQSHIGPPTTIAWGSIKDKFSGWENIKVENLYFTGTLSPFGNLLPTLCGTKIIYDKAKQKADKILIDTTGLIAEPVGRVLKENKINLIKPNLILALQREDELEHILGTFKNMDFAIFRLGIPPTVSRKTLSIREAYRKGKFKAYFSKDSQEIILSLENIAVRKIGAEKESLTKRLISLKDKEGNDLALGIIQKIDSKTLKALTPLKEKLNICGITIGKVTI